MGSDPFWSWYLQYCKHLPLVMKGPDISQFYDTGDCVSSTQSFGRQTTLNHSESDFGKFLGWRNTVLFLLRTFPWDRNEWLSARFKLLMAYSAFRLGTINVTPHLITITFLRSWKIRQEKTFNGLPVLANHTLYLSLISTWLYIPLEKVWSEITSLYWYLWPSLLFHMFLLHRFAGDGYCSD